MAECHGAIGVHSPGIRIRARRIKVIVVDRRSSDIVRKRNRELAGRVDVAEEHVGEGVAALLGGVELLDEGRRRVRDPGLGHGLAGAEDYDGRLARVDDGFDEVRHGAHEI